MRVDQFLKLRETDPDDLLEVYCIMADVTDKEKNTLLTKPFKHLVKLCNSIEVDHVDVKNDKLPFMVKIGRRLYRVPKDLSDLKTGRYYEISDIITLS